MNDTMNKPWHMSLRQWKEANGYPTPHIGEISGVQYARMSRSAQARYDRERNAEWNASSDGTNAYSARVLLAFDTGEIDEASQGLSQEAYDVIRGERARRDEAAQKAAKIAARAARDIDVETLKVGDVVQHLLYGMCTIVKVNRATVRVETERGDGALTVQKRFGFFLYPETPA